MGRARFLLYPGFGLRAKERAAVSLHFHSRAAGLPSREDDSLTHSGCLVASERRANALRGETARAAAVER